MRSYVTSAYAGLPYRVRRAGCTLTWCRSWRRRPPTWTRSPSDWSLHFFHAADYERAWHYSRSAGEKCSDRGTPRLCDRLLPAGAWSDAKAYSVANDDLAEVLDALGDVGMRRAYRAEAIVAYRKLGIRPGGARPGASLLLKEAGLQQRMGQLPRPSFRLLVYGAACCAMCQRRTSRRSAPGWPPGMPSASTCRATTQEPCAGAAGGRRGEAIGGSRGLGVRVQPAASVSPVPASGRGRAVRRPGAGRLRGPRGPRDAGALPEQSGHRRLARRPLGRSAELLERAGELSDASVTPPMRRTPSTTGRTCSSGSGGSRGRATAEGRRAVRPGGRRRRAAGVVRRETGKVRVGQARVDDARAALSEAREGLLAAGWSTRPSTSTRAGRVRSPRGRPRGER